jgi:GNAT superfamily N-acetyltransferase
MIRLCTSADLDAVLAIINDGAQAYKGIIPADRWSEPYMPREKLQHEIAAGVTFLGFQDADAEDADALAAVMGIQSVQDVTLIRHAYVLTSHQSQGIGSRLLQHLYQLTTAPVLIGAWTDATWAIRFYERHGFRTVSPEQKKLLLERYWSIPARQVETSVVLADNKWWQQNNTPYRTRGSD